VTLKPFVLLPVFFASLLSGRLVQIQSLPQYSTCHFNIEEYLEIKVTRRILRKGLNLYKTAREEGGKENWFVLLPVFFASLLSGRLVQIQSLPQYSTCHFNFQVISASAKIGS
jgi:hypothetical protein